MLDGTDTHYEPALLQKCKSKGVESLLLPPKCTKILQPLDKAEKGSYRDKRIIQHIIPAVTK